MGLKSNKDRFSDRWRHYEIVERLLNERTEDPKSKFAISFPEGA